MLMMMTSVNVQHTAKRLHEDRPVSFLSRLVGSDADQLHIIHSPYTNRFTLFFVSVLRGSCCGFLL